MKAVRVAVVGAILAMAGASTTGAAPTGAPCRPGPAASCAGADLDGARLTGRDLSRANLSRARLVGARLQRAHLVRANLTRANLTRARLRGADLRGAFLVKARLDRADLRGAKLGRLRAKGRRGAAANAVGVIAGLCSPPPGCTGDQRNAKAKDANFSGATLWQALLAGAHLPGARFTNAKFIGVEFINAKLEGADFTNASLDWVDFRGASLVGADFTGATFEGGVDFTGANLHGADLTGADLSESTLTAADLAGAHIDGARLPSYVQNSIPQTKAVAAKSFTATMTRGTTTVTCTNVTECLAAATFGSSWTLKVTTDWAGFAMCPDGPVRLGSTDGGATYTGSCTYTAFQGLTITIRAARTLTIKVEDGIGAPDVMPRIGVQWREPPSYGLVEYEHVCLGASVCIAQYPEGSSIMLVTTGNAPYHVPASASCQGGTTVGDLVMMASPPWELNCLVDGAGHPLPLTTDRLVVLTRS
jgi:uncharacterized protein YjbI with pentapeptide repeats